MGEREGLKQLGIQIDQSMIETELLARGQGELEGQARKLAEANIILELATRQSGDAIAFASSEGAENQLMLRDLQARWSELKDKLAEEFLPIAIQVGEWLVQFADWVEDEGIPAAVSFYNNIIKPYVDGFGEVIDQVQWLIDKVNALSTTIGAIPGLPDISGGLGGAVGGADGDAVGFSVRQAIGNVTGLRFAQGGVASAVTGGQEVTVGEAGEDEAIMPVSRLHELYPNMAGGGGVTIGQIIVEVGPGGDPAAVGRHVVDAIRAYERQNGQSWRAA